MLDFRKEDVVIQPKVHKHTLVFLPGWSRSALLDFNIFKTVPFLKNTRIRIVQAPHRRIFDNRDAALPSWFMVDMEIPNAIMPGLNETSKLIEDILQEEYEMCQQLFLGGFSQGGVTALYTGLVTSKIPLLGIFALSCFVPLANYKENRKHIPLFVFHGERDEIVNQKVTESMIMALLEKFNLTYNTDSCLGHTYSWKEFIQLKKWMESCLRSEKL